MASLSAFTCCLFAAVFLFRVEAQLFIYPASIFEKDLPTVTPFPIMRGSRICPRDISSKGINILCVPDSESKKAHFYINDELVFRDRRKPYFMARNNRMGLVRRWRNWSTYKGRVTVKCEQRRGRKKITSVTEVSFFLGCKRNMKGDMEDENVEKEDTMPTPEMVMDDDTEMPMKEDPEMPMKEDPEMPMEENPEMPMDDTPESGMDDMMPKLIARAAGEKMEDSEGIPLNNGMRLCPLTAFDNGDFNVECVSGESMTSKAEFFVDDVFVQKESVAPYFIAGDFPLRIRPWTDYPRVGEAKLTCSTTSKSGAVSTTNVLVSFECTQEERNAASGVRTTPDGCIEIDATKTSLSNGWERVPDGLGFRLQDSGLGIVGAGSAPLRYRFTPPGSYKYGFTMETTAAGVTDYNDVFVRFKEIGFQLMRGGELYEDKDDMEGKGWIKAYQNSGKKSLVASSVDFNPHSFATRTELEEGREYMIEVGGRSNMVVLHRIIMFPCEGDTCQQGSSIWRERLGVCSKLG